MRVEDHHDQIGALDKRRSERRAGLLDGDVVVLAVAAGQGGSGGALSIDGLVRVGVDVVDIIEATHLQFFLSFSVVVQVKGSGSLATSQSETVPITLSPIYWHRMG